MTSGAPLDRAALDALYRRLEGPVYNVVYRWIWEPEEAAEIVQEAFVRLWDMRSRVRPETVEALVFQIAMNLARKRKRWRRLRTFLGVADRLADSPGPEALAIGTERALAVRAAVDALPEAQRSVVVLCQFSGLSYGEVATLLGIPEGTVGSRRTNALKRLRAALETGHADG